MCELQIPTWGMKYVQETKEYPPYKMQSSKVFFICKFNSRIFVISTRCRCKLSICIFPGKNEDVWTFGSYNYHVSPQLRCAKKGHFKAKYPWSARYTSPLKSPPSDVIASDQHEVWTFNQNTTLSILCGFFTKKEKYATQRFFTAWKIPLLWEENIGNWLNFSVQLLRYPSAGGLSYWYCYLTAELGSANFNLAIDDYSFTLRFGTYTGIQNWKHQVPGVGTSRILSQFIYIVCKFSYLFWSVKL